jgi:hypothetical protein
MIFRSERSERRRSIDGDRLEEVCRTQVETLCRHFLPEGRQVGAHWRVPTSPRIGAKKNKPGSLDIQLAGPYAGCWRDWETDEHGAFPRLIMSRDKLTFPEAVDRISRCLGVDLTV